ncbi:torsin-3A isoform X2 [Equus quagga]|uniref:torsin-3A isoform X2 n=1 Tax=Equus quagga TaxID=89248 RepID=UPI001EE15706|nr:torsin-3A isoform X2 [Equus quagga]
MLRRPRSPLRLRLCLCVLLLLPLLGAPGHGGDAGPGPEAEKTGSRWAWPAFQGLQERLRAAGTLSRRYWALFSCRVWPEHCEEDEEAPAGPLAWGRALLGQQYLDILTTWYCSFQDCCDSGDCRISNNFTGLKSDLSVRLHGQHLAQELVLRTVRGYLELPRPDKALVLSFHGWSGTGKNFVARILAENLYRDGLRSDCVKVFIAMFHFPHPTSVDLYKEQLTGQIRKTQERCHQTLFIFDEAEKLHPGLLEALRPHLGRQAPENHRAQSPRTIFLFLRWEGKLSLKMEPKIQVTQSIFAINFHVLDFSIKVVNINSRLPQHTSYPYICSTDKTGKVKVVSVVITDNLKNPYLDLSPLSLRDASLPIEFTSTSQCQKVEESQINRKHTAQQLSGKGY